MHPTNVAVASSDVTWCLMVYTEGAGTAAVSRGTSHVTLNQTVTVLQVHHFSGYSKSAMKTTTATVTHLKSHVTKAQ